MNMLAKRQEDICKKCGDQLLTDHKKGQVVCTSCGFVSDKNFVDQTSEYRCFNENLSLKNDPRRVGNMVNTHLDNQIDLIEIDEGKRSYHIFSAQTNSDKVYQRGIKLNKHFCQLLELPDMIIKQVDDIYYEIQDKKELKGKRLETVIVACIYLACKRNLINVQPTAFEPLANVSQQKILKIIKIIIKFIQNVTIHAHEYIQQFSIKLKIPNEFVQIMVQMCKDIEGCDFFEMQLPKPRTIAAAVIYFFLSKQDAKYFKSINEIKDTAGILVDNTIKKYVIRMQEKKYFFDKYFDSEVVEQE